MRTARHGLAILLVCACGSDDEPAAPSTDTEPAPGSSGIDLGEDDDGGEVLDLGGGATAGDGIDSMSDGCKKVDLLFVIDNSGSMLDEQANLVASFPGFIEAMRAELGETQGYHVGITSSDLYGADFECPQEGALVISTLGDGASNETCTPYSSGGRFLTEQDDLEDKFACAAQIGVSGDGNERPMTTMLAALSPALATPGCNEGFLRDDALLVVVIITDEEDDHEQVGCVGSTNVDPQPGSAGEPAEWFDALVSIKGEERSIVVLSLVGPREGQMCPELDKCNGGIDGAEVGHRLIDFTEMFTYGYVGPVCEPYGPFFQAAIANIESACSEFTPQG
jgi:hypothetical protein